MQYGLYIHIPYCRARCNYCDFHTQGASSKVPDEYINAVLRDFEEYAPKDDENKPISPITVYFGGGTPGLLSEKQVAQMLSAFSPQKNAEITLEANPESVNEEKLKGWYKAGVNRLSFGVQTAKSESLASLGRRHSASDAEKALKTARKVGFTNISGDIMLGLAGYTNAEFDETLSLLRENGVVHISAYVLKVEENTPFGRDASLCLPSQDEVADMYLYAVQELEKAGYAQYEISNFAKKEMQSRHNLLYWNSENWLGIGPSAHSHINGKRFSFAPDTKLFLGNENIMQNESDMTAEDYAMLRMRLTEGLCEEEWKAKYKKEFTNSQVDFLHKLCKNNYAVWENGILRLTKNGMLVQNSILTALF